MRSSNSRSVAVEAVDEELRAVPPGLFLGVDRLQVGRVVLVLFRNLDLLPRDAGVDAVEDHGHTQTPRVHDPGLAQDLEQLGGAAHRSVGRAGSPPGPRPVRSASPTFERPRGRPGPHPDDGEHRALYGFANGGVGPLACPFEPGGEGLGVQGITVASTSQAPRIICERMTPEFPLAPISAALAPALLASSGLS